MPTPTHNAESRESDLPTPAELCLLAEQAARVGGTIARNAFGSSLQVRMKADQSEVTEADIVAERAIVDCIRSLRPRDAFLGEESCESAERKPPNAAPDSVGAIPLSSQVVNADHDLQLVTWIIDPIDGTRNFIRNMPLFACSVAALRAGTPIAGAIFEPIHDTLYSAHRGGGLRINGKPHVLTSDPRSPDADARRKLFIGIPSAHRPATAALVSHALDNHIVRNFGSVALHLALVALGHLDAAIVGNAKLWDIAAGCLLVVESGGIAAAPDDAPLFPIEPRALAGEELPLLAATRAAYARLRSELSSRT